jgi:hypothetical protein
MPSTNIRYSQDLKAWALRTGQPVYLPQIPKSSLRDKCAEICTWPLALSHTSNRVPSWDRCLSLLVIRSPCHGCHWYVVDMSPLRLGALLCDFASQVKWRFSGSTKLKLLKISWNRWDSFSFQGVVLGGFVSQGLTARSKIVRLIQMQSSVFWQHRKSLPGRGRPSYQSSTKVSKQSMLCRAVFFDSMSSEVPGFACRDCCCCGGLSTASPKGWCWARAGPVLVSSSYLCRNLSNIFRMELAVSV